MTIEAVQVGEDIPCRTCGYNLRSLASTAKCPECGTSVELSLRGDLLRFANPTWVNSVAVGVTFAIWGRVVTAISLLSFSDPSLFKRIFFLAFNDPSQLNFAIAGGGMFGPVRLIGFIICAIGAWCYTTAEPSRIEQQDRTARYVIRCYWLLIFIDGVACQVGYFRANLIVPLVLFDLIANLFAAVGLFTDIQYLQQLTRRIPKPKLASRGNLIKWAMPATLAIWGISATVRWRIFAAPSSGHPMIVTKLADLTRFIGATYAFLWVFFLIWLFQLRKQFIEQAKLSRLGS